MPRYAVTLHAEMNITADDEAEAVRNCNSDAREFVVQNEGLEVADVEEVNSNEVDLTEDIDDIVFHDSEVVEEPEPGWVDWVMAGVYVVVVDAPDPKAAGEAAKLLPKQLDAGLTASLG